MLRLKELREQKKLNQIGLAMKLNVSQSTISAYEKGGRTPDLETMISLAKIFHVSLDYLAGVSDVKQPFQHKDLSTGEWELLYRYRQLTDEDKAKTGAYMDGLLSR